MIETANLAAVDNREFGGSARRYKRQHFSFRSDPETESKHVISRTCFTRSVMFINLNSVPTAFVGFASKVVISSAKGAAYESQGQA